MLFFLNFSDRNPELNSSEDPFLNFINEVKNLGIMDQSFCRVLPMNRVAGLNRSEVAEAIQLIGEDPFDIDRRSIELERDLLVNHCLNYYTEIDNRFCVAGKMTSTIQEIARELRKWELRLRRLSEVISPDYSVTNGYNKRTNKTYRMLKAYWINDDGQRVRTFNKNVGISDGGIEHHFERYFRARGYEVTMGVKLANGWSPDLLIDKNKKQSIVDFKISHKEQFYPQFMSMEMWAHYQSIYYNQS